MQPLARISCTVIIWRRDGLEHELAGKDSQFRSRGRRRCTTTTMYDEECMFIHMKAISLPICPRTFDCEPRICRQTYPPDCSALGQLFCVMCENRLSRGAPWNAPDNQAGAREARSQEIWQVPIMHKQLQIPTTAHLVSSFEDPAT